MQYVPPIHHEYVCSEEDHSERRQSPPQCRPRLGLDCDAEYKSKCTATGAMVSKDRLRVRAAYRVALVMGQEVHSVAIPQPRSRQNADPIPFYNILAESRPPSGGNTISDIFTSDIGISGEHPSFLLVVGVVI